MIKDGSLVVMGFEVFQGSKGTEESSKDISVRP